MHEGAARAYAALGDADYRAQHLEQARAELALEGDPEDRQLIAEQMASVPEVP